MLGRPRRILKLCAVALAAAVVAVSVVTWLRRTETLRFQILDYVTGQPIRGATVEVARTWISLPLEKLPFFGLSSRYRRITVAKTAQVYIGGVPKLDPSCRIVIAAKGYGDAVIQQQSPEQTANPDLYWITYFGSNRLHGSYEYVNRKKPFTVALEPDAGGTGRAGACYTTVPSAGSRERAIAAVNPDGRGRLGRVEFRNGHWEIGFLRGSVGGSSWYDVSEEGEILARHPGE